MLHLDKFKKCKVLWIDAHADVNTPESSDSGNLHGMPLAYLTGLHPKMSWMPNVCLNPQDICYVGLRDVDDTEKQIINDHEISSFDMEYIKKHGWEHTLNKVHEFCENSQVHVSFDVDAIDPKFMPSTGTPVQNGLTMEMGKDLLEIPSCGLDIVETNITLGTVTDQIRTFHNTFELVEHALSKQISIN